MASNAIPSVHIILIGNEAIISEGLSLRGGGCVRHYLIAANKQNKRTPYGFLFAVGGWGSCFVLWFACWAGSDGFPVLLSWALASLTKGKFSVEVISPSVR